MKRKIAKTVGATEECSCVLDGKSYWSLANNGSQISSITLFFFRYNLVRNLEHGRHISTTGGNGLDIPVDGLLVVCFEIDGDRVECVHILVVKEPEEKVLSWKKEKKALGDLLGFWWIK